MRSRRALVPTVLLAMSLLVTGCGGDKNDGGTPGPTGSSTSPSSTESTGSSNAAYGVEVPAGLELTAPGSTLALGDIARIAWAPNKNTVGALLLKVTRLRQGTIKDFSGFDLQPSDRTSTPYYVDVTVQNIGTTDLSGVETPLYLVDQTNTLYGQNHFGGTFAPCAAKVLPDKFTPHKITKVCLVYLSPNHGTLTAISFRPSQEFNPITWTGTVEKPATKPTKKPRESPTP